MKDEASPIPYNLYSAHTSLCLLACGKLFDRQLSKTAFSTVCIIWRWEKSGESV